jgi:hypothetical protein
MIDRTFAQNIDNTLGRFYILAPENACSARDRMKLTDYEEVWQYGSNEIEDIPWQQDGVAPQCEVTGLPKDGRIFFPKEVTIDGEKKDIRNFRASHSVSNYFWIFDKDEIDIDEEGYVLPRN